MADLYIQYAPQSPLIGWSQIRMCVWITVTPTDNQGDFSNHRDTVQVSLYQRPCCSSALCIYLLHCVCT